MRPLLRTADGRHAPFLALLAGAAVSFGPAGPEHDGRPLPVDRRGRLVANLRRPSDYLAATFGMRALFARVERGQSIDVVAPGDVVVILPSMYSGHTDWVETAQGSTQGGFLLVSIINSTLASDWLRHYGDPVSGTALAVLAGVVLATFSPTAWFWPTLLLGLVALVSTGLASFAAWGIVLPWLYPGVGLTLASVAAHARRTRAAAIERARLAVEVLTAQKLQNHFFPSTPLVDEFIAASGRHEAATECSGDWWTYRRLGDDRYIFAVGDVTGHGAGAALLTAATSTNFLAYTKMLARGPDDTCSPAALLDYMNAMTLEVARGEALVTFAALVVEPRRRRLTMATAGHVPPLFVRRASPDGRPAEARRLMLRGHPLGGESDARYEERVVELAAGDRIVLLTDGIIETRNRRDEPYRYRKLADLCAARADLPREEFLDALLREIERHGQGVDQEDDRTLLVIDILGAPDGA